MPHYSYQANKVAKKIIFLLQKNKTTQEIIEDLGKEYDALEEDLYIDVSDFILKLKIYNLI
ncbi:PqqD family protein [Francisella halioticida]|uniref:PqqD family protein n=1 Tax=Francisella halioticida TaxID=549298 RepID=UPI001BB35153|nr:PqqD family protein [Francisella halioticida]